MNHSEERTCLPGARSGLRIWQVWPQFGSTVWQGVEYNIPVDNKGLVYATFSGENMLTWWSKMDFACDRRSQDEGRMFNKG